MNNLYKTKKKRNFTMRQQKNTLLRQSKRLTGGTEGYVSGKKISKKKRPSWYGVPSAPTITALKRSILDSYALTNIVCSVVIRNKRERT